MLNTPTWGQSFWLWWYLCIRLPNVHFVQMDTDHAETTNKGQRISIDRNLLSLGSHEQVTLQAVFLFFLFCHEMAHSLKHRNAHTHSPERRSSIQNKISYAGGYYLEERAFGYSVYPLYYPDPKKIKALSLFSIDDLSLAFNVDPPRLTPTRILKVQDIEEIVKGKMTFPHRLTFNRLDEEEAKKSLILYHPVFAFFVHNFNKPPPQRFDPIPFHLPNCEPDAPPRPNDLLMH